MPIKLKATCSECMTMHVAELEYDQEDIKCPACGHAMRNLPEGELNEIETAIKKQKTYNIVALIGFFIALLCFALWVLNQNPDLYSFGRKLDPEYKPNGMMQTGVAYITCAGLLVTLVFGILGSLKRYVVEF